MMEKIAEFTDVLVSFLNHLLLILLKSKKIAKL